MKQTPFLYEAELSGRIYIATRWRRHDDDVVEALEKYDVTTDFERIEARRSRVAQAMETDA